MAGKILDKLGEALKYHFVDSSAIVVESFPMAASFETFVAGMSSEVSMNSRLVSAALAYSGVGYIYGKGRDISRKLFKINEKSSERSQQIHDAAYTGVFNLVLSPPIYLAAGARDIQEIVVGTACAIGLGTVNGIPMGYAVDLFRDLTGIKKCERPSYPNSLKNMGKNMKRSLVVGITAASIGLVGLVYQLNQDKENHTTQVKQQIEQNGTHR